MAEGICSKKSYGSCSSSLLGFGYQKAVMVAALPHNRKTNSSTSARSSAEFTGWSVILVFFSFFLQFFCSHLFRFFSCLFFMTLGAGFAASAASSVGIIASPAITITAVAKKLLPMLYSPDYFVLLPSSFDLLQSFFPFGFFCGIVDRIDQDERNHSYEICRKL